jgi:hypothetical protein
VGSGSACYRASRYSRRDLGYNARLVRTIVPIYQSEISPPTHVRFLLSCQLDTVRSNDTLRGARWRAWNSRATS